MSDIARASIPQSQTPASCGRIVHVYSNLWRGPRPAVVTQAWGVSGGFQLINATVIQDGCNDSQLPQGASLGSIGLYEPLTADQRALLTQATPPAHVFHAEWMPYQAGQAKQTEDIAGKIAERVKVLEEAAIAPTPGGVNEELLRRALLCICILAEFAGSKQIAKIEALLSGNGGERTTLAETMESLRASIEE